MIIKDNEGTIIEKILSNKINNKKATELIKEQRTFNSMILNRIDEGFNDCNKYYDGSVANSDVKPVNNHKAIAVSSDDLSGFLARKLKFIKDVYPLIFIFIARNSAQDKLVLKEKMEYSLKAIKDEYEKIIEIIKNIKWYHSDTSVFKEFSELKDIVSEHSYG